MWRAVSPRIKVVSDFGEEKCWDVLTCRAHVGRRRRKSRTRSQASGQLVEVPVDDNANEIKKNRGHEIPRSFDRNPLRVMMLTRPSHVDMLDASRHRAQAPYGVRTVSVSVDSATA